MALQARKIAVTCKSLFYRGRGLSKSKTTRLDFEKKCGVHRFCSDTPKKNRTPKCVRFFFVLMPAGSLTEKVYLVNFDMYIITKRSLSEKHFPEIMADVNIHKPFCSKASLQFPVENATVLKISTEVLPTMAEFLGIAYISDNADFSELQSHTAI
jgi:hypothetical protein